MSQRTQFGLSVIIAIAIASGISHFTVRWLHIRTGVVSHHVYGDENAKPLAFLAGSSLMYGTLDYKRVSAELGTGMEIWFVAGSSPTEWEPFQSLAPSARVTLIGVSAYDLNEEFLCDFRSHIVPLGQTLKDLAAARSDWTYANRVVSQYPMRYLRILFPTAGRADGVLGGLKEQMRCMIRPWVTMESEMGPTVPALDVAGTNYHTERISEWTHGYLLRCLEKFGSACGGLHTYNGTKKLALRRMLERGRRQGRVIIVVLPVSISYQQKFLDTRTMKQFECALYATQMAVQGLEWVRLDRIAQLSSNEYYYDPVHLNVFGGQIATSAFMDYLKEPPLKEGRLDDLKMRAGGMPAHNY